MGPRRRQVVRGDGDREDHPRPRRVGGEARRLVGMEGMVLAVVVVVGTEAATEDPGLDLGMAPRRAASAGGSVAAGTVGARRVDMAGATTLARRLVLMAVGGTDRRVDMPSSRRRRRAGGWGWVRPLRLALLGLLAVRCLWMRLMIMMIMSTRRDTSKVSANFSLSLYFFSRSDSIVDIM